MNPDQQPPQYGRPSNWTPSPAYPIQNGPGPVVPYSAPQSPAGWQQQPQPGPYPPAYGPLIRPTSGMATASLVFGIAGLFLFCAVIPSVVAVLCGHSALAETRDGHKAGHGQAVAGLILGYAVVVPAVIFGVFWLVGLFTS